MKEIKSDNICRRTINAKHNRKLVFNELKFLIKQDSENDLKTFDNSSESLKKLIFGLNQTDFMQLVLEIGTIPEDIEHDSTEERLFSKATDIVLARTFQELNEKISAIKKYINSLRINA